MAWKRKSSLPPQSSRPKSSTSCTPLRAHPPLTPICSPCSGHTCTNSVSWAHQACAHCRALHLRFPLGWAVGGLTGGPLGPGTPLSPGSPGSPLEPLYPCMPGLPLDPGGPGCPCKKQDCKWSVSARILQHKVYTMWVPKLRHLWLTCYLICKNFLPTHKYCVAE